MAKIKKKIAEKVLNKKNESAKKSLNPFEVHINRQKYEILGQKSKNDRGLPGVSRAKAIRKRKHTLLPEYNVKHKSNKFLDRRIGEKNFAMTNEDRTMARFTAERMKHHKKSIYNLADDEILTHRGQTLSEIEKYEDPRSEDDDDDDVDEEGRKISGKLNDDFVNDAHFGGGILTKTGKEGAKTHKELIDQLIAESKKRKAEKQKTKEETLELTEKLDSEWKDLLPLVSKSNKSEEEKNVREKPDDYDKTMRELKFEARGKPTDRLKSEDEIAKEEKERLEKLEQDRLNRMRGVTEKPTNKHRSADDLDENFEYDSDPETLAYDQEGNLLSGTKNKPDEIEEVQKNDINNQSENEDSVEEESDSETDDDLSDLKQDESDSEEEQNQGKQDESDSEEEQNQEKQDESDSEEEQNQEKPEDELPTEIKIEEESDEETKTDTIRNEIMEKAEKELPYTFSLPESYEKLQTLLENQLPEYQGVIIERMIKCNHPSLAAENKENLGRLFVYLLQHLNDCSENIKSCFSVLNYLTPHLFTLTQLNPENSRNSILEVIQEKQNDYRRKQKNYPGVDVLIFLKLISCLFSTSDFRHQVVTPSFVFISQMLTNCRVKTRYDIVYGLFLVTLFIEYTTLSKRYLPAVIIYLMGILHMSVPKIGVRVLKVIPPFKSNSAGLVLSTNCKYISNFKMYADDFIEPEIDEEFKIKVLYNALKLGQELQENWKDLPSEINIFEPYFELLEKIPKDDYPNEVQEEINKSMNKFEESKKNKKLNYIVAEKKKPKALRLYEPNIVQVFEFKRTKPMSKEKAEREKLLHKYKKEMKGALREIRRDKSFIGRVKIKEQIHSDYERREKVKRIYAEASMQQSELNSMDRKKKRK